MPESLKVLSITDYDGAVKINQLRFQLSGLQVEQLFDPQITSTGLVDQGREIDPNQFDVVYAEYMHDYRTGISMARALRGMTDKPLILAVNYYIDQVRSEVEPGLVDKLIDLPYDRKRFNQLVEDIQSLASNRK